MDLGSSYSSAFAGDLDRARFPVLLKEESSGEDVLESLAKADEPASEPELGIALVVRSAHAERSGLI